MEQVIERLSTQPDCDEILITYQTDNDAARKLYASLGFVEQKVDENKITARLDLKWNGSRSRQSLIACGPTASPARCGFGFVSEDKMTARLEWK